MARYDVVVIGAGLGGLTAAAILARAGRKVLVIERSNSVGGAASSYKVGDLFVEGSLHETSDPHDPADPKYDPLGRAGVRDAVTFVAADAFYEVRGGPLSESLRVPDNFPDAEAALAARFPNATDALARFFGELADAAKSPAGNEAQLTLSDKLQALFGAREDIKCALAANLAYYHDDPSTLSWSHFAHAQGSYLASGARYVQGGSQRLSSALARAVRQAGGDVLIRRVVSSIGLDANGSASSVTHTAKDGSDPKTVEGARIVSNAAPRALSQLFPKQAAATLDDHYAPFVPSISLFALTLGLSSPPREFGLRAYSTHLLPRWMTSLADFARAKRLMADEPGDAMPPLSIADYNAIDSGVPAPPYVLSIFGPDHLGNWDASDMDAYRAKRGRWQEAIVGALDRELPGLAGAIVATSFNSALSVRQYLDAPDGAVYGFAPTPANARAGANSPRTPITGLYLASAYAGAGGYSGVIAGGAACADMILAET
jgi:phytoene dehydrogenase-like protein